MSDEEVGIEEARKILGDLVNRVSYTGSEIILTRNGKPVARLAPLEPAMSTTSVVWSVVRGEAPHARIVDPGPAGITIPDDVLDWAGSHGHDPADPDVWIAVAAADDAGPVPGEIAYRDGTIPTVEAENLRD